MEIKDNFIIEQLIMPDTKPAYKITFVDKQHMNDNQYFKRLSHQERLLLKPYFMEIGGHWSEAHKAFVFIREISTGMIREAIQKANNQIPLSKEQEEREKLQAYFTPIDIAKRMQESAHISEDDIILDPSAGTGNLVNGLKVSKDRIFLVEPNIEFCELLRRNGYIHVSQSTFEDALNKKLIPNNVSKILMNPPFSDQTDLKHITLAYNILVPGGTLVGILGKNSLLQRGDNNQKSPVLKNFINICDSSNSNKVVSLEPGSFEKSGTICDTCMVVLEKERIKKLDNVSPNSIEDEGR